MHGALARGVVATLAVVAAGVGAGLPLLHNGSDGDRRTHVVASPTTSAKATSRYKLPPLGAAGFQARVYPLALRGRQPGTVAACPSAVGLQPPTGRTRRQAVRITRQLETRSFMADLHATDRAYWPGILRDWRRGYAHPQHANGGRILHTGLLSAPWPRLGVPDPRTWVRQSCGAAVMHDSYVVAGGPANGPALQNADLFVVRDGRALLYFSYP